MPAHASTSATVVAGSGRDGSRCGTGAAVRRTASAWAATDCGQRAEQLAERAPDRALGVGGVVLTVERGHHQSERLVGAEPQRRRSDAAAEPVAALRATDRLHRDVGLAEDLDVPPRGPRGDAEPPAEALGGDAGGVLERLEGEQGAGGRAGLGGMSLLMRK